MLYFLFAIILQISLSTARIDTSPVNDDPDPSFEYCIGPNCPPNPARPVSDEAVTDPSTGPAPPAPPVNCPLNDTQFLPDVNDCHRYYICYGGTPAHLTCPDGMAYQVEMRLCVSEKFVKTCLGVVNCGKNGLMADVNDCSRFYNCFYGYPYHLRCPVGTKFDPVSRQCSASVPCLSGKPHDHSGAKKKNRIKGTKRFRVA